MPETFPDGFPMIPAEAIEYSYFFSESEKQDWREWLTTASSQEQSELVDMLHKIWLDKQKQAIPNQFSNNNSNFSPDLSTQNQSQIHTEMANNLTGQSDFYENNNSASGQLTQEIIAPMSQPTTDLSSFNYESEENSALIADLNPQTSPDFPKTDLAQSPIPDFSFETTANALPETSVLPQETINTAQTDDLVDSDDDFDFNFDDALNDEPVVDSVDSLETAAASEPQNMVPTAENQIETKVDDYYQEPELETSEAQSFETDTDISTKPSIDLAQDNTELKPNPSFSISKIREGTTSHELDVLYQNYLDHRTGFSSSRNNKDQSYDELMQKVISIVLNFETVADYLEFMITKLSQMNETIIKQAEEIASFKNGQNNHAHDLEQNLNQVLAKIATIEKNQNLDFEQYRARLDSLEIKHTGQNNSAYSEYDNLNTQIDLLKSKLIKLEKIVMKEPEASPDQDKKPSNLEPSNLGTAIPVPKNNYQTHLPLSQKLKDFTSGENTEKL